MSPIKNQNQEISKVSIHGLSWIRKNENEPYYAAYAATFNALLEELERDNTFKQTFLSVYPPYKDMVKLSPTTLNLFEYLIQSLKSLNIQIKKYGPNIFEAEKFYQTLRSIYNYFMLRSIK